MSCLERFLWTKLPRSVVPACKGILGYWAHLAARAVFRKGIVSYCGHRNPVEPGTWAGGIVGLKSILGVKKREQALDILRQLSDLGYLSFELDAKTKLLTYHVTDYELDYCGAPCDNGAVYATLGYGFLCVPRSITERLVAQNYIFNLSFRKKRTIWNGNYSKKLYVQLCKPEDFHLTLVRTKRLEVAPDAGMRFR